MTSNIKSYFARRFFDGQQMHENVVVRLNGQYIEQIQLNSQHSDEMLLEGLLVPGFIDIQVNGGGGVLFNNNPNVATLDTMAAAHLRFGTTSMLPTVITDKLSIMGQAADAISEVVAAQHPNIIGVHFEGPHLDLTKRGIHPANCVRPISDKELAIFTRSDLGNVILTVAPETVPADIIKELVDQGIIVCLGHSNASSDITLAALAAGAQGFTHLYNAMSPLTSREPGMVGAALSSEQAYCGIIVDHHHVHPLSVKLAYQCKGAERLILVTDAMAHVGSELLQLDYQDTVIVRDGNKLTLPNGTLAGSALDMNSAVKNCHFDLKIVAEDCLKMASSTPAKLLKQQNSLGYLKPGNVANMLLLDSQLTIQTSWLKGIEQNNNNNH